MIQYISEGVKVPQIKKQKINRWIKAVAADYDKKIGDIAYIFCNENRILEINQKYLQHDYYTDIITFDDSERNLISGDIFICIDTVKSNAEKFQTDFMQELYRVMIHGILHLCGQDDKTSEQKEEMTFEENKALSQLKEILSPEI